jgi:hypothetical protein
MNAFSRFPPILQAVVAIHATWSAMRFKLVS